MQSHSKKGEAPVIGPTEASMKTTTAIKQQELSMNHSTKTDTGSVITPSLTVENGEVTTTSLQIAEHFGKRHADVLRAINKLECSVDFTERNFALSEFTDSTGRKLPAYRITRDGFVFLAMGFTGKEAAQWKEAYITAFNKMERDLRAAYDYTRISPAQAQNLRELVELVAATGKQKHGETWARLQRKFKVNSYHELPAAKFGEACEYLRSKMSQEDIGGLVQKHFTQQIELLNVKKQFELDYGEGRSLHFTPSQQLAINQKSFDMAKEVFELSVQHITQQVYGQTPGSLNGSVTDAQVKKGVDRTTLSSALLGKYAQDLYCISATAAMAVTIAKQTKIKLDKELSRIGFGGLIEPSAL